MIQITSGNPCREERVFEGLDSAYILIALLIHCLFETGIGSGRRHG